MRPSIAATTNKPKKICPNSGNFLSNFEPLTRADARNLVEDSIGFVKYTDPMRRLILASAGEEGGVDYFLPPPATTASWTANPPRTPRYLQKRPDVTNARDTHLAEVAARLQRRIPLDAPLYTPVNAVMPGRRNNPPDPVSHIRSLAVFGPIHYLELPELFMEFISSMTGKSPSTTGAGSEGAMTKGPFNALPPIIDLNAALVSFALTGYDAFISAAGYIGPKMRVDHDVSLLIPEVWCRMAPEERRPKFLIDNGYLEKCADFEYAGKSPGQPPRLAHDLQFRPHLFRPRLQLSLRRFPGRSAASRAAGPRHLRRRHGQHCHHPPIDRRQLLRRWQHRMGLSATAMPPAHYGPRPRTKAATKSTRPSAPSSRAKNIIASDWYAARLAAKQEHDIHLWKRHATYLQNFLKKKNYEEEAKRLGLAAKLETAWATYHQVKSPEYLGGLQGTIGLHPLPPAA